MRLPSLNALRAFEAAARHQSFAKAASELHVTEGAVSRHIKLLEEELGVLLFRRLVRKVELTDQGHLLLPALAGAFAQIADAAGKVAAKKTELRVAVGPSFSIRWLVPRLHRFSARNLGFSVHLTTSDAAMSLVTDGSHDLAINCGCWPEPSFPKNVKKVRLLAEATTPVCSPAFAAAAGLDRPEKLREVELLHSSGDYADWSIWAKAFAETGVEVARGQIYPNRDLACRAAIMGTGVTIGDLALLGEELASRTLMVPFPDLVFRSPAHQYYIVVRKECWEEPRIAAFASWLIEERDASMRDLQAA
ncbi:LysR substrate-binding domain-containing protein [Aestuariivirga sp.]|uniref:LysR substrate-binding domain-containing protein n=1 Tax=Aestuariivirga sp. TaxID=2650926 RepID=UPI003918DF98